MKIDTKQKCATSRCLTVILEFVDHKYYGFNNPNEHLPETYKSKHSGDALCLLEDNPKKSSARMGARMVNPVKLDIGLVIDWLSECGRRHPKICWSAWSESLQRIFLIDIEARTIVSYPRAGCDYIALSYVWGGVDQSVPSAGIPGGPLPMSLPATIEDAMALAKALGKRYLWVDSICIDQKDQDKKLEQINLMSDIYRGAYMTIIAMSGTSANSGLARFGHNPVVQPQVQFSTKSGTVLGIGPTLSYLISQLPWAKRAWTFQEATLSQRCLYLTKFQAYFECNAMQCCESLNSFDFPISEYPEEPVYDETGQVATKTDQGELRNPFVPGLITGEGGPLTHYCTLVEQYKRRAMTYESDEINAFTGILQAMERSYFSNGFLLGLPVAWLHCALLWEKVDASLGKPNQNFPSWTWASWSGSVQMTLVDRMCHFGDQSLGGYLCRDLTIWQKARRGITRIFALNPNNYSRFARELFEPGTFALEDDGCFQTLSNMSSTDAEHVLCIECYQLSFRFNIAHPEQPRSRHGHKFTKTARGVELHLTVSDGSEFFESPGSADRKRFLVIGTHDNFAPPSIVHYLLCIEPVGRFWKRAGVVRLTVPTNHMDALFELRPCRTRVLLV